MKLLVIGLEGATPELLFEDERLTNVRQLMEAGCYGRLESIVPTPSASAWLCMATGQAPESLEHVHGHTRPGDSPDRSHPQAIQSPTLWDQIQQEGKQIVLYGLPPDCMPHAEPGLALGNPSLYPPCLQTEIAPLVETPTRAAVTVSSSDPAALLDAIYTMSRQHFTVLRHLVQHSSWDYLHTVLPAPAPLQRAFWHPDSPACGTMRDYYVYLDAELGRVLESLDDDTAFLLLSPHGIQCLETAGTALTTGSFILVVPNALAAGEIEGMHLRQIAPTLLHIGGYPVPASMQGAPGLSAQAEESNALDAEEAIRERLRGLGYIA